MPKQFAEIRNWLSTSDSEFFAKSEFLIVFPESKIPVLNALSEQLRVISFGLPVAQFKKNDLFARTILLHFRSIEIRIFLIPLSSIFAMLCFFRKKTKSGSVQQPKAWLLVQYQGVPLGFVKNLGKPRQQLLSEGMAHPYDFAGIAGAMV